MEEIRKITIEGYEDTFNDWEDGPEAFDEIVTYDLKTRELEGLLILLVKE